jgi:hypothetical protein
MSPRLLLLVAPVDVKIAALMPVKCGQSFNQRGSSQLRDRIVSGKYRKHAEMMHALA